MQPPLNTVTLDYLITDSDYTVLVDAALGDVTISLIPSDIDSRGRIYVIKKIDATLNLVILAADGTDLIDGQNLIYINTKNESVTIQADGNGNWRIL
jgi:hypothetical protein